MGLVAAGRRASVVLVALLHCSIAALFGIRFFVLVFVVVFQI